MEFEKTITPSAESIKIANRLKELRSKKELSFEQLKKVLLEEYDIKISVDSLKNYEITEDHIRANSNLGMRIEYLNCFADFYGVTTDYLLGRTDDPSPHPAAVDQLGLSPSVISKIARLSPECKKTLCRILMHHSFSELLSKVERNRKAIQAERNYLQSLCEQQISIDDVTSGLIITEDLLYRKIIQMYPSLKDRLFIVTGSEAISKQRDAIGTLFLKILDNVTSWGKLQELEELQKITAEKNYRDYLGKH